MIHKILPIIFLCACSIHAEYNKDDWIELNKIHVCKHAPTQQQVIFCNSFTCMGPECNEWHIADVSHIVSSEAKAVNLTGILIITHGTSHEIANMTLYFRRWGEDQDYLYCDQVVEAHICGGQRSPLSIWVPLSDDKKFEFKWTRSNDGQWPLWSAYGINLSLNAWGE